MSRPRVLFLSASPRTQDSLFLDEEARAIEQKVRAAAFRDSLEFVTKWAVRPDDLMQALLEHKPHIVHFSGHGSPANEILLIGDDGHERPVSAETLRQLFRVLRDNVRLVVFNACFAEGQARAIVESVDCAIGMSDAISDTAAIVFAGSLYRAIGFGRTVLDAFDLAKVALMLEGIPEDHIPRLLFKDGVDPGDVRLVDVGDSSTGDSPERGGIAIGGSVRGSCIVNGDGNRVRIERRP